MSKKSNKSFSDASPNGAAGEVTSDTNAKAADKPNRVIFMLWGIPLLFLIIATILKEVFE